MHKANGLNRDTEKRKQMKKIMVGNVIAIVPFSDPNPVSAYRTAKSSMVMENGNESSL